MQNEFYLLIGSLIGFIFTLAATTIILLFPRRSKSKKTTLGDLRHILSKVQEDVKNAEKQVWDYGTSEETKSQAWRIACTSIAGKAVSVLQSCWYEREKDSTSQAIYDELLVGLKSVGLVEIKPTIGQEVDENDNRYRIENRTMVPPPYQVSKLLCPSYIFKPNSGRAEGFKDIILEPAQIEVAGEKPNR